MAAIRFGFGRLNFHLLKRRSFLLLKLIAFVCSVLLFCEFFIYYLVILRCNWPEVKTPAHDREQETLEPVLKAMFLADTHLLGEIRGHWLDKLRREWQMERAFQTALWLLQPEVVFILGDIFDEGKWSSPQAWADDVERFQKMFRHPGHVQLKVVVGNHDIGFHYQMNRYRIKRFEKVFNPERLFSWKGINFVMVNSVALEGDGCNICSEAEAELMGISHKLNCSREEQRPGQCGDGQPLPASAPVLLQHFPLYRPSDANCSGEDAAPPGEKGIPFKERYDVLSREASQKVCQLTRLSGKPDESAAVVAPAAPGPERPHAQRLRGAPRGGGPRGQRAVFQLEEQKQPQCHHGQLDAHRVRPGQVLPSLGGHGSDHVLCSSGVPCGPRAGSPWTSSLTCSFWL
ncbi:metallophosphoesterase 1 isoform X2 [Eptesicus fuscus]|uniref:metallophosphoesterase 1 isoform X2 n=1 Tax=Eptesicus fuscus TaxID=29078 RepID=UPI0024048294|nr:metallophosphoesterase 1 isoform X2 [Eptesicus fuscus]